MPEDNTVATSGLTSTLHSGWENGRDSIEVRPVVPLPYSRMVFFVLGGDSVSKPQAKRLFPDHMYMDIPNIVKTLSLAAILICMLSLAVFLVTGFSAVQPIIAILVAAASATFYAMAEIIKRSYHDRV
jgi:hypothetical protein